MLKGGRLGSSWAITDHRDAVHQRVHLIIMHDQVRLHLSLRIVVDGANTSGRRAQRVPSKELLSVVYHLASIV